MVTSSCASVLRVTTEPRVFSEKDWNEQAIDIVKEQGKSAPPIAKYRASKTLAEKGMCLILDETGIDVILDAVAAWDFVKKNEGKINWDLVVLNPPFVIHFFRMYLFISLTFAFYQ